MRTTDIPSVTPPSPTRRATASSASARSASAATSTSPTSPGRRAGTCSASTSSCAPCSATSPGTSSTARSTSTACSAPSTTTARSTCSPAASTTPTARPSSTTSRTSRRRLIRETFKAMLDDWTNAGVRPVRQPGRDGQALRRRSTATTPRPITRRAGRRQAHGRRARRRADPDRRHPSRSTACSPTCRRTSPRSHAEPGFEGEVRRVQPVRLPQPLRRHVEPVGRQPCARPASTARPPRSTCCR